MNKAEEVIKRLRDENKRFVIKILGDEKNKNNACSILMNSGQGMLCLEDDVYDGIKQSTIDLLNEAEIKFSVIE